MVLWLVFWPFICEILSGFVSAQVAQTEELWTSRLEKSVVDSPVFFNPTNFICQKIVFFSSHNRAFNKTRNNNNRAYNRYVSPFFSSFCLRKQGSPQEINLEFE